MKEKLNQLPEKDKTGESRYVIESVMKTLQILFTFRLAPYEFSITEIEALTRMSKNQVFRSLKSLEEFGVIRMLANGKYVVTPMIYQLVPAVGLDAPIEEVAQPFMEKLQVITGETVNLCCLVEGQSVLVARKDSKHGVRLTSTVGIRSPLHVGASPKAMLAFFPPEEQEKVYAMVPYYQKYTEKTVNDPDLLRAEMAETKERGYSISDEDFELGARGTGAPIFDQHGRVVAGITVGGPISRVGYDKLPEFGQLVIEEAKRISRLLGYYPESQ